MYGQPEITKQKIKCEDCERWFKKLTHLHLWRIHQLTIAGYKAKWGLCKTQPLEAFYIKKLRQDYVVQYGHGERLKPYAKKFAFRRGHASDFERRQQHTLHSQINGAKFHGHSFAKASAIAKKIWQNPAYRAQQATLGKQRTATPADRMEMKRRSRLGWADPRARARHRHKEKLFWNSPLGKKLASERAKKMWRNPIMRAKILQSRKNKH